MNDKPTMQDFMNMPEDESLPVIERVVRLANEDQRSMSDNPQIIDKILARLYHDGRMLPYSYDMEHEVINQAKQAIKEAILTEVIGEDVNPGVGYETMATDELNEEKNFPIKAMIMRRASQNLLRIKQRQRLDAWLGLEDTSNE